MMRHHSREGHANRTTQRRAGGLANATRVIGTALNETVKPLHTLQELADEADKAAPREDVRRVRGDKRGLGIQAHELELHQRRGDIHRMSAEEREKFRPPNLHGVHSRDHMHGQHQHHVHGARSYEHMHRGHHPDHSELMAVFYFVFGFMVAAQIGLYYWRKNHPRSYQLVTLLGLWLIPPILSFELMFIRFLLTWVVFSAVTGYLVFKSSKKPMIEKTTPRLVYGWFLVMHNVCVGLGTGGYVLVALDILGIGPAILRPLFGLPPDWGFLLLFYGLYYGVLARDCAEMCADRMVSSMGHTSRGWTPSINVCALCGGELKDFEHLGDEAPIEKTVQLNCKHLFHEFCIRGWTIVGKKDTCPYCSEKVAIKDVLGNPKWQRNSILWNQLCDAMRYLVVWNPVMLVGIQLSLYLLGFMSHHHHHNHEGMEEGAEVIMVEVVEVGH